MATGYTIDIPKGLSVKKFILRCSRAFLICMRDRPWNEPIPKEVVPNPYHKIMWEKAEAELKKLNEMPSFEKVQVLVDAEFEQKTKEYKEELRTLKKELASFEAMEKAIKNWEPPTEHHKGLKDFMLHQLRISIAACGSASQIKKPKLKTAEQYIEEKIADYTDDLAYHAKEYAKEVEASAQTTRWIQALLKSVKHLD